MRSKNSALVSALISAIMVAGQAVQAVPNGDVKFDKILKLEANSSVLLSNPKNARNPQVEIKAPVNNFKIAKGPQEEVKAPVNNLKIAKGPQVETKAPVNNLKIAKGPQVEIKAPVNNLKVAKGPQVEIKAPVNNLKIAKGPQVEIKAPVNNLKIAKGPQEEVKAPVNSFKVVEDSRLNTGINSQTNKEFFNNNPKKLSTGAKFAIGTGVALPVGIATAYGVCRVANLLVERWKAEKLALQDEICKFLNSITVDVGWGLLHGCELDGWIKVTQGTRKYYICFVKIEDDFALLSTDDYNLALKCNKSLKGHLINAINSSENIFFKTIVGICDEKSGNPLFTDCSDISVLEGSDFVSELIENNENLCCVKGNIVEKIYKKYGGWQKYFSVTGNKYQELTNLVSESVSESGSSFAKLEALANNQLTEKV